MSARVSSLPGLTQWLGMGERGLSSDTIVMHLTGRARPRVPSVPYDPADFRRCELLLRSVFGLREQMPRMAELGPDWAYLVEKWDEIVETLEAEVPGCFNGIDGKAPRAYALISSALNEGSRS